MRSRGRSRGLLAEQANSVPYQPPFLTRPAELGRGHGRRTGNEPSTSGFSVFKQDTQGGDLTNVIADFTGSFKPVVYINSPASTSTVDTTEGISYIRKALSKNYGIQAAWIIPLPFDDDLLLKPEEHFVELSMETLDRSGVFERGGLTQLSAMLDPISEDESGMGASHILIRGEAGFGKSTLCTKIGHDWAHGKTTFPPLPCDTTLLILFRLRELPKGSDPEQVLLEMVHSHSSYPEGDLSETRKLLRSYTGNILLLLDGYDEISRDLQEQVKNKLLKTKTTGPQSPFRNAVVIITSRLVSDKELLRLFDRHFIIQGLSDNNTRKLVELYFSKEKGFQGNVEKKVIEVMATTETIRENMSPIIIVLLCYICEQEHISISSDLEDFMVQVIFLFAKRCSERESFNIEDGEIWCKLLILGRYFFHCLKSGQLLFQEAELQHYLGNDFVFLTKCGALKRPFSVNKRDNACFEPTHKLLMESLTIYFLNKEFSTLHDEESQGRFCDCTFDSELSTDAYIVEHDGALEQFRWLDGNFQVALRFRMNGGFKFKIKSLIYNVFGGNFVKWSCIHCIRGECKLQETFIMDILRMTFHYSLYCKETFFWRQVNRLQISHNTTHNISKLILFEDPENIVRFLKEAIYTVARSCDRPDYEPVYINMDFRESLEIKGSIWSFMLRLLVCTAIGDLQIKGCVEFVGETNNTLQFYFAPKRQINFCVLNHGAETICSSKIELKEFMDSGSDMIENWLRKIRVFVT